MMIRMAWRNIWRNKRRSFITLSSIAFAVFFSTLMMSVQKGSLDQMIDNSVKFYTGHLQIQDPKFKDEKSINNSFAYSPDLVDNLSHIDGVEAVSPRIESFALASYGAGSRAAMVLGVNPEKEDQVMVLSKKLAKGKMINADSRGVLAGSGLAEYLNVGINDTLVLISQGYHGVNAAGLFVIEGILKFPNPMQNKQMIVMPLKQAQWFYDLNGRLTSAAILLKNYKSIPDVEVQASAFLNSEEQQIVSWEEMTPELIQTANMKYATSRVMIVILYAVIGFGMFGTFLMMTAERKREFGIMLSIGMKRRLLQSVVFLEILLLSALGVIVGLAISSVMLTYFHFNPIGLASSQETIAEAYGMEFAIRFSLQRSIFLFQAFAVFIIATILSFYPLVVIKKTNPVEAIREG